jgi:CRISPR system Cascade subunit CasC
MKIDDDKKKELAKKELERLEKEQEKDNKALLKTFGAKPIKDAIKSVQLKDAADIALFGRMVANDHSLTIEAASMFSHALSTHKADNEIDFFAAVDDLQPKEESGAGMTSTLEFNSDTYYRFAALNLDMLTDKDQLASMTREERQDVVRTFLEAIIKAIPGARKNTMNGNTLPVYVLGVVREKGHPIQLVNAFENPVRSSQGYAAKSVELLESEYEKIEGTWGIKAVFKKAIPEIGMKTFLDGMVQHVI